MKKFTKLSISAWFVIAVVIYLAGAFEGSAIRVASADLSSLSIVMLRYAFCVPLILPFFLIENRRKSVSLKFFLLFLLLGLVIAIEPFLYTMAVAESSASFVSIIQLANPILFVIISTIITRDKITRHAMIGLMFAILGSVAIVMLPALTTGTIGGAYGLWPVLILMFQMLIVAVIRVLYRKENERGIPMMAMLLPVYLGHAIVFTTVNFVMNGGGAVINELSATPLTSWLAVIYMAAIPSVIHHQVWVKCYEKLGTTSIAIFNYFGIFLHILIPLLILGERLSWEMLAGGCLIMVGVVFARLHHKKRVAH
jgi:drug/metabolite transporter (DMT)-like permease